MFSVIHRYERLKHIYFYYTRWPGHRHMFPGYSVDTVLIAAFFQTTWSRLENELHEDILYNKNEIKEHTYHVYTSFYIV